MSTSQATDTATTKKDALVERLVEAAGGAFTIFSVHIGDQLGFYKALADADPGLTSTELAGRTNTDERYVREWLEQQTVAGILAVADPSAPASERLFSLPTGHDEVLTDEESLDYVAPLAQLLVGATHPLDKVLNAYRNGGGVAYHEYGKDLREGQARINRTAFLQLLGQEWIPAMADVHERLHADPPARVADIGCGAGWSSIGIAEHYPKVHVDGFDLDEASIEMAVEYVKQHNLTDRVKVAVRDAGDPELKGKYDLVTAFECVHDMSNPVAVLQVMRGLAGDNGTVLIADERVGDAFTHKGNDVEWMMYGWSVLHCLPVGMADEPSAATGTVMRTGTLRDYAKQAGFSEVEVLPIDHFFFRFYRLK